MASPSVSLQLHNGAVDDPWSSLRLQVMHTPPPLSGISTFSHFAMDTALSQSLTQAKASYYTSLPRDGQGTLCHTSMIPTLAGGRYDTPLLAQT